MEMSFGLRQEQVMKLAPQIIQSIEILQLPLLALEERLQTELVENPVLEISEDTEKPVTPPEGEERVPDTFESLGEDWREYWNQGGGRTVRHVEHDRKLEAMQNTAARGQSLQDYLLGQLGLLDLSERQMTIAENIVYNLDTNGYLQYPLGDLLPSMSEPNVTLPEAEEVLRIIQTLDPPGVAARDLRECLLLQLDPDDPQHGLHRELILNHLEDIRTNHFTRIAKKTGRPLDEVKTSVEHILTLSPKPGTLFDTTEPAYILPDVIVEYEQGRYEVRLQESSLPRLTISPFYRKLLSAPGDNASTKDYIRKKIQSARWLINSIEQRRSTLLRVATAIVDAQPEFMEKGPSALKPLRMQEIAKRVGIHVSTVSRAISGKYIQTPQGIFEMKYFFTGGTEMSGGVTTSWSSIREAIGKLIEDEDKRHPLSDDEIARRLSGQSVEVSRRTVTKYRKAMGTPSSRRRRKY
jgi:RNA polymerase sigma-54 factor